MRNDWWRIEIIRSDQSRLLRAVMAGVAILTGFIALSFLLNHSFFPRFAFDNEMAMLMLNAVTELLESLKIPVAGVVVGYIAGRKGWLYGGLAGMVFAGIVVVLSSALFFLQPDFTADWLANQSDESFVTRYGVIFAEVVVVMVAHVIGLSVAGLAGEYLKKLQVERQQRGS